MKSSALLAPALCLALAGCNDLATSVVCSPHPEASVLVGVFDASGASVAAEARGTWSTGVMADSLRHVRTFDGTWYLAAYGPAGVYEIRVQRRGHADWVRGGLRVEATECGPATLQVTAQMQNLADGGGEVR